MIELYLHTKIYLDYFRGRLKYAELGKSTLLTFWVPLPKICVYLSTKPYWGLWFNWTHPPLFQNMPVKIYTNFLLSSGGCNFKIYHLKDKIRRTIWVHILLNNLASSPLQHKYYFWHRRWVKILRKSSKTLSWNVSV